VSVQLHIERLVLDGLELSTRDGPALVAALEHELARRLATARAWPEGGAGVHRVRGEPVRIASGASPAALGTAIGGSIHASLGEAVGR
jgi:hypothetical protein